MAEADLDAVIRQTAKQQHKTLMAAVKARFKQLAKDAMEFGTAAAKRLQVSADNAADSYARSMRNAAEVAVPVKKAVKKAKG